MKIITLTKKHLTIALALCLSGALIAVSAGLAAQAKRLIPIYCVDTERKAIALTFDAAWGNEDTETLISILAKYNAKATFFVVGDWVEKYPESVKQLHDAGHQVQNHSNTHPDMATLSKEQILEQLNSCNDKIEAITGVRPNLFRAPFGSYNNNLLTSTAELGMHTIQWDVDSRDWKEEYTTDMIVHGVLDNVKQGSIVLFHNAAANTPEALPRILDKLTELGFEFVHVNDLIYYDNYTIDHMGKQIQNKKDG